MAFTARFILLCLSALSISTAVTLSAVTPTAAAGGRHVAYNCDGDTIAVKPIDDPDNPYLGQYGPWDLWVWENHDPAVRTSDYQRFYDGDTLGWKQPDGTVMPQNWELDSMLVDDAGFPVPSTVSYLAEYELDPVLTIKELESFPRQPDPTKYRIYSCGIQPEGMSDEEMAAHSRALAAILPPIPAWLGEHLPLKLMFMPGGEFLCFGELGLHYRELSTVHSAIDYGQRTETWYRYSAEGELLGSRPQSENPTLQSWHLLYWPESDLVFDAAAEELQAKGKVTIIRGGHRGYRCLGFSPQADGMATAQEMLKQKRELVRAWDLFGNEVNLNAPVEYPQYIASPYQREKVEEIYRAQVELGLTDPDAVSPFAGKENGPQVVDPTPRFPFRFARHTSDWYKTIDLVPPESPANPYRGQYREWDIWMLENVGAWNPRQTEHQNEQLKLMEERVAAKKAAGEPVTREDRGIPAYEKPADDEWTQYHIRVDNNGCIIPAVKYSELMARRPLRDLRSTASEPDNVDYLLISEGIMPEEMLAEFELARYLASSGKFPVIPDWLADNPVFRVVFVPNGDIVTLGPLGHRTAEIVGTGREVIWQDVERAWYRYDAEGNLLSTRPSSDYIWQRVYCPDWDKLESSASLSGLKTSTPSGYLIIRDPNTEEIKAVFDYDGSPVDPNSRVTRQYPYCTILTWSQIEDHLAMQQRLREAGIDL